MCRWERKNWKVKRTVERDGVVNLHNACRTFQGIFRLSE